MRPSDEKTRTLWLASHMRSFALEAKDGTIGSISDLLCDDDSWTIRWFVVDTGSWLPGRKVLLPPSCFGSVDETRRTISVALDQEQIKSSPGVDTDKPVSRQMESALYNHYGWPPYWAGGLGYMPVLEHPATAPPPAYTGMGGSPRGDAIVAEARARAERDAKPDRAGDPHLRSVSYITGFSIAASDGDIGHVEDFLIDDDGWRIRYMIVDTVSWWPSKKVLMSPDWAHDVSWRERRISVDHTRQQVKDSPEYDPSSQVSRIYEESLYTHYGYPPYWF